MAKRKFKSPLKGCWQIVSMTEWDEEYLDEEVETFTEFDADDLGKFQFGYVQGDIDYRTTERDFSQLQGGNFPTCSKHSR